MVRACVSGDVDSGLIRVGSNQPLEAHHKRIDVKNKPASLLLVPRGKALSGISHLSKASNP